MEQHFRGPPVPSVKPRRRIKTPAGVFSNNIEAGKHYGLLPNTAHKRAALRLKGWSYIDPPHGGDGFWQQLAEKLNKKGLRKSDGGLLTAHALKQNWLRLCEVRKREVVQSRPCRDGSAGGPKIATSASVQDETT